MATPSATETPQARSIEAPETRLPAPWSSERVESQRAPRALLAAWRVADNRTWCAPIAPVGQERARARRLDVGGGWAVEFDERGLPGVKRDGTACTDCGRGAFGIAGTAIDVDAEDPNAGDAERVVYEDGSVARLELAVDETEEPVGHVATLELEGQRCVYQVWSLVSPEHLESLVGSLRYVDAD